MHKYVGFNEKRKAESGRRQKHRHGGEGDNPAPARGNKTRAVRGGQKQLQHQRRRGSLGGGRVAHGGLGVLYGDAQLLSELFELLQVFTSARAGGLVAFLEELLAVLGNRVHYLLELVELVHICGPFGRGWGAEGAEG